MKKLYEMRKGSRSAALYKPFWRTLLNRKKGYVLGIGLKRNEKTYPAFPQTFHSLEDMREYMGELSVDNNKSYEGRFTRDFIYHIQQTASQTRESRLYPADTAFLIYDALINTNVLTQTIEGLKVQINACEKLLDRQATKENTIEALQKQLDASSRELLSAQQQAAIYKSNLDVAEKLLDGVSDLEGQNAELRGQSQSLASKLTDLERNTSREEIERLETDIIELEAENAQLKEGKRSVERAFRYAKGLLQLPHAQLAAAVSVLPQIIPPKSKIHPAKKYHTTTAGHHRPHGYHEFVSELCEIPYVNHVTEWGGPRSNHRELVRVNGDGIVVFYYADKPQELLLKTTAETDIQKEFVVEYIRNEIYEGKRERKKPLNLVITKLITNGRS